MVYKKIVLIIKYIINKFNLTHCALYVYDKWSIRIIIVLTYYNRNVIRDLGYLRRFLIYYLCFVFVTIINYWFTIPGQYKWVEKKGISQCDINLTFKTTKFDSTIVGYIKINDASTALNIIFEYTFDKAVTLDVIKIQMKISDRSTKALSSLQGILQLESSAYPHINHVTSAVYQVIYFINIYTLY